MPYALTFLEGLISFISPCFLPMLPVYIAYFAGGAEAGKGGSAFSGALMFVLGFTTVFMAFGMFAGSVGSVLAGYRKVLGIACGALVAVFGLGYMELIPLRLFRGRNLARVPKGMLSSLLFGAVFSVSLTPCVGAFLGSALALASNRGSVAEGALLLLSYSMGLGVPLLLSAVLLSGLSGVFDFLKRHYKTIRFISGAFLVITGILMMFGVLDALLSLLS
jgi:cytochrome c-type biogenesis protein